MYEMNLRLRRGNRRKIAVSLIDLRRLAKGV